LHLVWRWPSRGKSYPTWSWTAISTGVLPWPQVSRIAGAPPRGGRAGGKSPPVDRGPYPIRHPHRHRLWTQPRAAILFPPPARVVGPARRGPAGPEFAPALGRPA